MFGFKKVNPRPLGVPLDQLQYLVKQAKRKAVIRGNSLLIDKGLTRVDVLAPEHPEQAEETIRAVVRVITKLQGPIREVFSKDQNAAVIMNKFAALGGVFRDQGIDYMGSRLTIYEEEDAWQSLHFLLLFFAAADGYSSLDGAVRRAFTGEQLCAESSEWSVSDFDFVQSNLSPLCVCTAEETSFTAEFGLSSGAVSSAFGDHETALFQLRSDQPHPGIGGGLMAILQMPQCFGEQKALFECCAVFNELEMEAEELPPHFGSWCPGNAGNNPAYVSFFPNVLHTGIPGLALNAAYWAMARAEWANDMLNAGS